MDEFSAFSLKRDFFGLSETHKNSHESYYHYVCLLCVFRLTAMNRITIIYDYGNSPSGGNFVTKRAPKRETHYKYSLTTFRRPKADPGESWWIKRPPRPYTQP